jgi:hypothetical protein
MLNNDDNDVTMEFGKGSAVYFHTHSLSCSTQTFNGAFHTSSLAQNCLDCSLLGLVAVELHFQTFTSSHSRVIHSTSSIK